MSEGVDARLAAATVLLAVLEKKRTLDDVLSSDSRFLALEGSDRGFARALVSETLRQLGRIDSALGALTDRPLSSLSPAVRMLLRIGACQCWRLGTPDHAVVGETVAAAKAWTPARRASGLINAVLRRAVASQDAFDQIPMSHLWPHWLWTDMVTRLGEPAATQLVEAQVAPPELHLTAKSTSAEALAAEIGGTVCGPVSVSLPMQSVEDIPGFSEGRWWVQDAAATLPALLLRPEPADHVADICAAPGGKTLQLAATGATVTAVDRSRPRLRRLRQNLERVGMSGVDIVAEDATEWDPGRKFDRILLDAPCSALGTLRRHPEGAWIKSPEDIARFASIQTRLLAASHALLKPGGLLVYCVCSPRREEGLDIVKPAVDDCQFLRKPVAAGEIPGFEDCITAEGDVLTLPLEGREHDAFYIARLAKPSIEA